MVALLALVALGLLALWLRGPVVDLGVGEAEAPIGGATGVQSEAPGSNLSVTLSECRRAGDSLRAEGYVRNTGGVVVRYVQVEVVWQDAAGASVDRHVTFAIQGEVFTPGDSLGFRAATGVPTASDCSASLFDYEPL